MFAFAVCTRLCGDPWAWSCATFWMLRFKLFCLWFELFIMVLLCSTVVLALVPSLHWDGPFAQWAFPWDPVIVLANACCLFFGEGNVLAAGFWLCCCRAALGLVWWRRGKREVALGSWRWVAALDCLAHILLVLSVVKSLCVLCAACCHSGTSSLGLVSWGCTGLRHERKATGKKKEDRLWAKNRRQAQPAKKGWNKKTEEVRTKPLPTAKFKIKKPVGLKIHVVFCWFFSSPLCWASWRKR